MPTRVLKGRNRNHFSGFTPELFRTISPCSGVSISEPRGGMILWSGRTGSENSHCLVLIQFSVVPEYIAVKFNFAVKPRQFSSGLSEYDFIIYSKTINRAARAGRTVGFHIPHYSVSGIIICVRRLKASEFWNAGRWFPVYANGNSGKRLSSGLSGSVRQQK